ncbi:unnamed protein product [Adineta steineri]|uniref:Uncharacterized protein n=1 Tax=Adineta steineri TaxID=433720 RepID=A0A814MMZ0_9BILA|nr:unnamed protein product [Adineta steineri]CAF3483007.1 unnamed protein product [Adineta steineri]
MSYEEIDKSVYSNDVFTNGAKGRYSKAEHTSETSTKTGEKKKRAPKIPTSAVDDSAEHPYESAYTDEVVKTKKKSRQTHENSGIENEPEASQPTPSMDGEPVVKIKKKRAPKVEANIENIDPLPTDEVEPVKKKKSKAPKAVPTDGDFQTTDNPTMNELDPTAEMTPKVKKPKKHKSNKSIDPSIDTFDSNNYGDYTNAGIYLFI